MAEICTYRQPHGQALQVCTAPATHGLQWPWNAGYPAEAVPVTDPARQRPYLCATHATQVAAQLNTRWEAARDAPKDLMPKKQRVYAECCAVCGDRFGDDQARYGVPGVTGQCCNACADAAQSAQVEDWRQGRQVTKHKKGVVA